MTNSDLEGAAARAEASSWLVANLDLVDRDRPVLDVACGRGRHTLWLARQGWRVHAIDRNAEALATIEQQARAADLAVTVECRDLENDAVDLGDGLYGTVLVFNYLHRLLVPVLVKALGPGGVLLYETFTRGQRERGHPRNPDFLLQDGELPRLFAALDLLRSREGDFDGRLIASIAARKGSSAKIWRP